jgi:hypothetical protein
MKDHGKINCERFRAASGHGMDGDRASQAHHLLKINAFMATAVDAHDFNRTWRVTCHRFCDAA